MGFCGKLSGLIGKSLCQNSLSGPAPNAHMLNAMRCMATKLFVGGLSYGTTDDSLREAFSSYGEVTEARVITDRENGRSRGFGFVNYTTDESASQAVSSMDGQELDGRNIRVNIANSGGSRGGSGYGGGYGGGGYGGGYGGGSRNQDGY